MNRTLAFAVVCIMILSTGCIGQQSTKTDSFKTRPSFLNVYLCADRLISDNVSDSTYCSALHRLLDRDSSALADISQSAADNPEHAYLQGSHLYIESIYEPHEKKRNDMQAAAIDYMRTASELGIHQATEMIEEYVSTKHIYRLEHFNTQIIGNDNYALSDDGHIILN